MHLRENLNMRIRLLAWAIIATLASGCTMSVKRVRTNVQTAYLGRKCSINAGNDA
jgi:hypothetical protein